MISMLLNKMLEAEIKELKAELKKKEMIIERLEKTLTACEKFIEELLEEEKDDISQYRSFNVQSRN